MFAVAAMEGRSSSIDMETILPTGQGGGRGGEETRNSRLARKKPVKLLKKTVKEGNREYCKEPFISGLNKRMIAGCNHFLSLLGANSKLEFTEPELLDLEIPQTYRPKDFHSTCQATGFSPASLRRLYRGYKTECPSGLMTEEAFRQVFAKFFPNGASCSAYSHYVFSSMDPEDTGVVYFEEFAQTLSLLRRGSLEEKLAWTFHLYDLNGDGVLSREEFEDMTISIYSLMGDKETGSPPPSEVINSRVEMVDKKFGLTRDSKGGGISLEQFLAVCMEDKDIQQALVVLGENGSR